MSIRMNYKMYPIDYIEELKRKGVKGRRKAMAFMAYFHDFQMKEVNSIRFYAEYWNVSHTAVLKWIKEFKEEIERFYAYWSMQNMQHYNSIQNPSFQQVSEMFPQKTTENKAKNKHKKTESFQQVSKEFNIYDDNKELSSQNLRKDKREFDEVFFIYRANTKFAGKKDEAFEEYMKIKDKVSLKELLRAIVLYLRDPKDIKQ